MKKLSFTTPVVLLAAACASAPDKTPSTAKLMQPMGAVTDFAYPPEAVTPEPKQASASLWDTSPTALLGMRRAKEVGDLLTVVVEMNDQASLQSSLSRSRQADSDVSIDSLFGLEKAAGAILPAGSTLSPAVGYGSDSNLNGNGTVNRAEQVTFTLAARVVGVEPNGNLVIQGYQQTRVSDEIRYLSVTGVVRAQDITRMNTVTYEKIAEAQLVYVSEGEATSPVSRKAGAKLVDWITPF